MDVSFLSYPSDFNWSTVTSGHFLPELFSTNKGKSPGNRQQVHQTIHFWLFYHIALFLVRKRGNLKSMFLLLFLYFYSKRQKLLCQKYNYKVLLRKVAKLQTSFFDPLVSTDANCNQSLKMM